jgi:hypothetical protein
METAESRSTAAVQIPWPGPVPYDESHARQFVGRRDKIRELVSRVQAARITILLGESGSGKTSLIRAGVVPELRVSRYSKREEGVGAWATLLLREGGAKREDTVEENWLDQLDSAITAMEAWETSSGQRGASEDAKFIRSVVDGYSGTSTRSRFVDLIEEIAQRVADRAASMSAESGSNAGGGIVLVFDQFEEQLRSGPIAQRDAFRLIHDIIVGGRPVRILLSMRKEFRAELRSLEALIGELGRNSVYLDRLESQRVVKVIEEVSKRGGVSIRRSVAERIVGWLTPDYMADSAGDSPDAAAGGESDWAIAHAARPDLLKMQAVLVQLCRWANQREIDDELFRSFIADLGAFGKTALIDRAVAGDRDAEKELGEIVLGSALERWIEAAISSDETDLETEPRREPSPYAQQSALSPEELGFQVRRIAVRMATLMSSGDYKIQQEETALFRAALGEEIAKLPLLNPMSVSELEINENPESGKVYIEKLGAFTELEGRKKWEYLSGAARGWTAQETGDRLLACFKETLERLSLGNILRRTPVGIAGQRKNYWELVHDQFGPNFVKWSANQRGTWDDCKNSLVICRGIQPLSVAKDEIAPLKGKSFYDVDGISWQGCNVSQARQKALTFRRIRFRDCYFVGTIFDSINFIDCRFERCEMNGCLFRECNLQATSFDQCDANIAFLGGSVEDLEFHDCHLSQPVIKSYLDGGIHFTGGSRAIQGLFDIVLRGDPGKLAISFDADSSAAYCLASHESFRLFKFDNLDLNCDVSPLNDSVRVRP